jgi:hypothetical protein
MLYFTGWAFHAVKYSSFYKNLKSGREQEECSRQNAEDRGERALSGGLTNRDNCDTISSRGE